MSRLERALARAVSIEDLRRLARRRLPRLVFEFIDGGGYALRQRLVGGVLGFGTVEGDGENAVLGACEYFVGHDGFLGQLISDAPMAASGSTIFAREAASGLEAVPICARFLMPCMIAARRKKQNAR